MKYSKLFIVDGSYLLHRNLKQPDLGELTNKNGDKTGGIFGFLRSLGKEFRGIDAPILVTWDSGLSPRRIEIYNDYKGNNSRNRDRILRNASSRREADEMCNKLNLESESIERIRESVAEVMRDPDYRSTYFDDSDDYVQQYHRQRDVLINILNSLGVPSIKIKDWEGDDLITLVTRMSNKSVVMTDDKDMLQLLSKDTDILRPLHKDYLTLDKYLNIEGYDDIREMVIVKAITGDGSDKIPSVTSDCDRKYSLGVTRAKPVAKLIMKYNENPEEYLKILESENKNYYKGFIENHDNYIRNMKLVDLSLVEDDESVMNHIREEINSKVGKCNLMNAVSLLTEQAISSFDVNGFISHMALVSTKLRYE